MPEYQIIPEQPLEALVGLLLLVRLQQGPTVGVTEGGPLQQIVMGAQEGARLLVHVGLVLVLEGMAERQAVDIMEVVGAGGQELTAQPDFQELLLRAIQGQMELRMQTILAGVPDRQALIAVARPQQGVMALTGVVEAEAVEVTREQAPQEQGAQDMMVIIGLRLGRLGRELEEADQEAARTLILRAQVEQEGYMGAEEVLVE
jgi:hypothetical protein